MKLDDAVIARIDEAIGSVVVTDPTKTVSPESRPA